MDWTKIEIQFPRNNKHVWNCFLRHFSPLKFVTAFFTWIVLNIYLTKSFMKFSENISIPYFSWFSVTFLSNLILKIFSLHPFEFRKLRKQSFFFWIVIKFRYQHSQLVEFNKCILTACSVRNLNFVVVSFFLSFLFGTKIDKYAMDWYWIL